MLEKHLFCVPVVGNNLEEFLFNLSQIQAKNQFVELRTDYIENFQPEIVHEIKQNLTSKAIFTCRKEAHGGKFTGNLVTWKNILQTALSAGFDFVDIEFPDNRHLDLNKKHPQTELILSYHHFSHTPGYQNLRKIQKRMRGYKADLMKFATFVKTDEDNQNLMRLLVSKKSSDRMILIGMGKKGMLVRSLAPLFGSEVSFVADEKNKTADGQMAMQEMEKILNGFKITN